MHNTSTIPPAVKLSICITTLNRAAFIGATLESIIGQLTADCEVVVLDGASTDDTQSVVSEYARRCDRLRYIRQEKNNGFDQDCDRCVELAAGEYCWLMTDDDLLKPGAVATVLKGLQRQPSVVIVNVESRDLSMTRVMERRWLDFRSDRTYGLEELDRLFVEVSDIVMYVGSVVIKRAIWLERERRQYYGSLFIHVGVMFQRRLPAEALLIAEPFVSYRVGNGHTYSAKVIEILYGKWPTLVGSLALSEAARRRVKSGEPWKNPRRLFLLRGWGFYSLSEYRCWVRPRLSSLFDRFNAVVVALLPGVVVNLLLMLYFSARQDLRWVHALRQSQHHLLNWRVFKRTS